MNSKPLKLVLRNLQVVSASRNYWKQNFKGIAYNRYCDSLEYDPLIERRITNVVMGFEALFSVTSNLELKFPINLRIAKLLSKLGFVAVEVKGKLDDAYDIRSKFAHGGILSIREKSKFQIKYGSIEVLLRDILEYLRICLLIMVTKSQKKDIIQLIDRSFLDNEANKMLGKVLSSVKI